MTSDESYRALTEGLGRVIQAAARAELSLRTVVAALLESKYAAVVVAGATTSWLIDTAQAVASVHDSVSEEDMASLRGTLSHCRSALDRRNRLAHGAWAIGSAGDVFSHTSRYRQVEWNKTPVTLQALDEVTAELNRVIHELAMWVARALSPTALGIEAQLRWEQYAESMPPEEVERLRKLSAGDE